MKIDDVPRWSVSFGVGHVVVAINSGWMHLACGDMVSRDVDDTTSVRPTSVCKRCRAALPKLTLIAMKAKR